MFSQRTVFILGAGASAEAKLPIGSELALAISKKMDIRYDHWEDRRVGGGDVELYEALKRKFPKNARQVQHVCWRIRDGIHLVNSIDDFLDLHRDDFELVQVGKAAIVKCILDAERTSNLHFDWRKADSGIKFPDLHGTWFAKFMKLAVRDVPLKNADKIFENVSFIVFNYDRCLEHFLLHALQRLYNLDEHSAVTICKQIKIIHPYGLVAPLETNTSQGGVRFGEPKEADCANLADNIRTYTEQIGEGQELADIRTQVEQAECLIFLGFAFHRQNMRLLAPPLLMEPKPVFATAFGMSTDDTELSRDQIGALFRGSQYNFIRIKNELRSADLFDNYSKWLAS